jgi:hypothetical protein
MSKRWLEGDFLRGKHVLPTVQEGATGKWQQNDRPDIDT